MSPAAPATEPVTSLACAGCGRAIPTTEPFPFVCPAADATDDIDHVIRRSLDPEQIEHPDTLFDDPEPNPFLRYRQLLHSYQVGRARGLGDTDYRILVEALDRSIARVEERAEGFRQTSFAPAEKLAKVLGMAEDQLWIKDETGNVSGSHKARHLMGLLLWLEVARRTGLARPDDTGRPLAIASCGNAALAAAVVAVAGSRALDVFVPPHVDPWIRQRMETLGARLHLSPRRPGEAGDPCFLRFREALDQGALPFTCQGSTNGLTLEGGQTLAWEMVSELRRRGTHIDHLILQVGGGALASACIQGLTEARALGMLDSMPKIHTLQTQGAHPLERAWRRLAIHLLDDTSGDPAMLAARMTSLPKSDQRAALEHATRHRAAFMWPWEDEPRSIATGILDDETYDWLAVLRGMLETGGIPLVADETTLHDAHQLAHRTTKIPADPTGTAGLAGLLELRRHLELFDERVALLFTGREREPQPKPSR